MSLHEAGPMRYPVPMSPRGAGWVLAWSHLGVSYPVRPGFACACALDSCFDDSIDPVEVDGRCSLCKTPLVLAPDLGPPLSREEVAELYRAAWLPRKVEPKLLDVYEPLTI